MESLCCRVRLLQCDKQKFTARVGISSSHVVPNTSCILSLGNRVVSLEQYLKSTAHGSSSQT